MRFSSQLPRPSWSCQYEKVCLDSCLRLVVWYGLDQLSQVVEIFSPLMDCLVLPAQLNLSDISSDKIEGGEGLFRRGEGVNVFSEHSYRLRIYLEAMETFLHHQAPYTLDLHLNVENIINFGQTLLPRLEEDKTVFRFTRSKKVFEIVTSFENLVHLVSKFSLTKSPLSGSDQQEIEKLASSMEKVSLWS